MTIERLEQYADLCKEVALLKSRMERTEEFAFTRVSDTVKASSPEFPFTEHTVTVRGYSDARISRFHRIQQQYMQRERKLRQELQAIEEWISGITDSKVRQIVEYKYVLGHTWSATGRRVYGHPGAGDAARKLLVRHLEKQKEV